MIRRPIAAALAALCVSACTTTPAQLKQNDEHRDQWTVNAPLKEVFQRYTAHAEEKIAGGDFLWSGGYRVRAHYYGDTAEITVPLEGNPFYKLTGMQCDLAAVDQKTSVVCWWATLFESKVQSLKSLMPTEPSSG